MPGTVATSGEGKTVENIREEEGGLALCMRIVYTCCPKSRMLGSAPVGSALVAHRTVVYTVGTQ